MCLAIVERFSLPNSSLRFVGPGRRPCRESATYALTISAADRAGLAITFPPCLSDFPPSIQARPLKLDARLPLCGLTSKVSGGEACGASCKFVASQREDSVSEDVELIADSSVAKRSPPLVGVEAA